MRLQTLVTAVVVAFALNACMVYRPEIRQGNFIEDAKFAKIKPGMTREQVRFLVGPPMIADAFHTEQWDYFYTIEAQYIAAGQLRRHFVVRFDGDFVTNVEELD